ncbi:MAG TPA: hypothetical protein VII47_09775 [Actinomycetota bacterium]|jgi:hypothetical protein
MQRWFADHETVHAVTVTTPEGRLLGMVTPSRLDAAAPAAPGTA